MKEKFTSYQLFVVVLLAFLQFTVVLDFMILSPLGAVLITTLDITPAQFGRVVSAYAFSAGVSGLLAAGFADQFDRRKLLHFFYSGFLGGTLLSRRPTTFFFSRASSPGSSAASSGRSASRSSRTCSRSRCAAG